MQLFQVVVNLLNNAYDAVAMLGPGEPRWVKMDLTCDGQDLYLSVTDSGHKISSDVHANLFQRFYTTKPLGQGTGLGLYLSRRIVESHHGQIWHDTDHPHTRFVVKLPQYQGYARSSHVEQGQAI